MPRRLTPAKSRDLGLGRAARPRKASGEGVSRRPAGYVTGMKLLRTAALAGVAKKVYDESKKPENQRRIKEAVASVKARRAKRGR
jgi:hypothetical protein